MESSGDGDFRSGPGEVRSRRKWAGYGLEDEEWRRLNHEFRRFSRRLKLGKCRFGRGEVRSTLGELERHRKTAKTGREDEESRWEDEMPRWEDGSRWWWRDDGDRSKGEVNRRRKRRPLVAGAWSEKVKGRRKNEDEQPPCSRYLHFSFIE